MTRSQIILLNFLLKKQNEAKEEYHRRHAQLQTSVDMVRAICDHKHPDGTSAYNSVGDQCTICLN